MVADAASLHDHLASNGVRIVKGLRDADYGLTANSRLNAFAKANSEVSARR